MTTTASDRGWCAYSHDGALAFLATFLVLPLVSVFAEAQGRCGLRRRAPLNPEALAAIRLTLLAAGIALAQPVFGRRRPGRRRSDSRAATCSR
jgi:ABC-type sulfate transport system permease subunit